jgi:hypothetical protein
MESIERGEHVVVTAYGDKDSGFEKFAGVLAEVADDGYVFIVTHRMMPLERVLPEDAVKTIRSITDGMPVWRIRLAGALERIPGWRWMAVDDLRALIRGLIEERTLAGMPTMAKLQEIGAPIKTFYNGGEIKTMEATVDVNKDFHLDVAVKQFADGLDAEIEKLLTEADEAGKETNDVHTEQGSEDTPRGD